MIDSETNIRNYFYKYIVFYVELADMNVIFLDTEPISGWTELGGAEGAQAPPSFLDLCSKNYKISQIREENSFFY